MTDRPSPFTLRELRDHMLPPVARMIFAGRTAVRTVVAPFDSPRFGLVPRFGPWMAIVVPTDAAGDAIHVARGRPARRAASAPFAALAVCLLLLRLTDAMTETGETAGMQVHRAHWVAVKQVKTASRTGDRAILTMAQGPDIPVSHRDIPALTEAGLLP